MGLSSDISKSRTLDPNEELTLVINEHRSFRDVTFTGYSPGEADFELEFRFGDQIVSTASVTAAPWTDSIFERQSWPVPVKNGMRQGPSVNAILRNTSGVRAHFKIQGSWQID